MPKVNPVHSKKLIVSVMAIAALILSGLMLSLVSPSKAYADSSNQQAAVLSTGASKWNVSFSPVVNTTKTRIKLAGLKEMLKDKSVDSIEVTATMSYGGKQTRQVKRTVALSAFDTKTLSAELNFGDYGKWKATTVFKKSGAAVKTVTTATVGIVADTYNISPVSATLPVTFFSLNLWGQGNIRESGPVILLMERPSAYDWDKLPSGVFGLPYLSQADLRYQPGDFGAASSKFRSHKQAMSDYVRDLLSLRPSSKINLYCVDVYVDLVQRILYANNVPEKQYKIYLLSDGSYTATRFDESYNGTNPSAQHKKLVSEWTAAKKRARANGKADASFSSGCGKYLWAMVDSEPNAQLWVARKDLLVTKKDGNAFGTSVQNNSKVVQVSIGNLLEQNIKSSTRNIREFKALYNFNDSYFAAAKKQGKDVMVFLGTRANLEPNFEDYARFVMSYYGDNYAYYYKGHPATPTDLYPEKAAELERLNVTDVDASVAAELILFFNPEIYLSGYSSSTYASVPAGMGKGMFNMTKAAGLADPQYENMEFWMTRVSDETDKRVRNLCLSSHSNYLVEFADKIRKAKNFDIAIWDATASEISYYKLRNGAYELVGIENGMAGVAALADGVYTIASNLQANKVLDVAAGSRSSKANVRLYDYNATGAQQWRISFGDDGLATIVNVRSGLALDVAGARSANGTNVRQFTPNGTRAQKWSIEQNQNGTFKIASAVADGPVLDIAGAKTANGTNAWIYEGNGTEAQEFKFYPVAPKVSTSGQANLASGYYKISSAVNTNLVLEVGGWGSGNGSNASVWTDHGIDSQLFKITRLSNGFYQIVNAWNDKALDVDNGKTVPGTNVQFWNANANNKNQQWAIVEHTGGSFTFQNVASGLMLDLTGGRNANGTNVHAYTPNGTQAQRWIVRSASDPHKALDALAAQNTNTLLDGTYVINSELFFGLALDVRGASRSNGANVQTYSANRTDAQLFTVSHDKNGYVTFTNKGSGRVIDVAGSRKGNGVNVWQYESNGTRAQKWIVKRNPGGTYTITSALSSRLVLDVAGASVMPGANVQLYQSNGTNAQKFTFTRVG